MILSLKQQLATAKPAQLATISAAVGAALAQAAATGRLAQQAASDGANNTSLTSARQAAREAVNEFEDAYFKERKFDPYLRFASEEDEREYRRHEAERHVEIEQAQAKGTPEGDKRAADLSIDQMRDAGAHGADRSPDYAPLMKKLADSKATLDLQIENAKPNATSVAQTKADPLDGSDLPAAVPSDLLAKFKATGVVVADQTGSGHGVSVEATAQDRGSRMPS